MSIFQRDPRAGVFLGGQRVSGQDIRDQNGNSPIRVHGRVLLEAYIDYSHRCSIHREHCQKLPRSSGTGQDARGQHRRSSDGLFHLVPTVFNPSVS